MEPMAKEAFVSPVGVHVVPPSVERQMPPCAPPTRTVFPVESLGSTAMASIRPDTGLKKPPVVGAGPRRPRSANGRARLWDHSGEATIRPANELAFGFH